MKYFTVTFLPENLRIEVPEDSTLMQAITVAGLDLDFPCGGKGTCGKCRIKIPNAAPEDHPEAIYSLSQREIDQGIRLACRTIVTKTMEVELLSYSRPIQKILHIGADSAGRLKNTITEKHSMEEFLQHPHITKRYLELAFPSIENQQADWERIVSGLSMSGISDYKFAASIPFLRSLPEKLRSSEYRITAVCRESEILGLESGDTSDILLGAAFDLGTTTLVCYLLDLLSGKELAVASSLNPQVKFGADVISRTNYCEEHQDGLESLNTVLVDAMNALIEDCAEKAGIGAEDIYAVSVVGNTCIHHFFLGISPGYIARAPFIPAVSSPIEFSGRELGVNINSAGRVFVLPTVAGFVGADTVGVVLDSGMDEDKRIKLAIDIGTNGEMVLGCKDRLLTCSTAAGPAFEGAHISCGMCGAEGAIDHADFTDDFIFTVIGDVSPIGICGSGLLDIIAGLQKHGIINKYGKLLGPDEIMKESGKAFASRLMDFNGESTFLVAGETNTANGRPLYVTQKDIRAIQLAKGALSAGIQVLFEEFGITSSEVEEVLLAGAFGNYMRPCSACLTGMLPGELESRISVIGNAAGSGARKALVSRQEYLRAGLIAKKMEHIELGSRNDFNLKFARGTRFDS